MVIIAPESPPTEHGCTEQRFHNQSPNSATLRSCPACQSWLSAGLTWDPQRICSSWEWPSRSQQLVMRLRVSFCFRVEPNKLKSCRAGKSSERENHLCSPTLGSHWPSITTFHFLRADDLTTALGLLSWIRQELTQSSNCS